MHLCLDKLPVKPRVQGARALHAAKGVHLFNDFYNEAISMISLTSRGDGGDRAGSAEEVEVQPGQLPPVIFLDNDFTRLI